MSGWERLAERLARIRDTADSDLNAVAWLMESDKKKAEKRLHRIRRNLRSDLSAAIEEAEELEPRANPWATEEPREIWPVWMGL